MKKLIMATVVALGIASTATSAMAYDHGYGWHDQWYRGRPHYVNRGPVIAVQSGYAAYPAPYYAPAPVVYAPPPPPPAPVYYPPSTSLFLGFRL